MRSLCNKTEVKALRRKLLTLANKYENSSFLNSDPSWFMHQVLGKRNQETIAFIASCLSYGSRRVFIPRIQYLLDCSRSEPYEWIRSGRFALDIPDNDQCFYRLYTNSMLRALLHALQTMYETYGDLENYIRYYANINKDNPQTDAITAIEAICEFFLKHDAIGIVPKNTTSSCKRICMFLRWMVRTDSSVDLGIWSDFIHQRSLIIPLDTHVIQQSLQLGLISSKTASMSVARKLTDKLLEIFPDDPLKADFALFGYGVSH
ncbi:TIGR02757 family protein [Prevotella scopos JCM 17725]|nr:TIGR02757 family protein [Prevotella scopos JCM 17725]